MPTHRLGILPGWTSKHWWVGEGSRRDRGLGKLLASCTEERERERPGHAVGPIDGVKRDPSDSEGGDSKVVYGAAPTEDLDIRHRWHWRLHPGTGSLARPQCIRGYYHCVTEKCHSHGSLGAEKRNDSAGEGRQQRIRQSVNKWQQISTL
jgi:hypothetical protein